MIKERPREMIIPGSRLASMSSSRTLPVPPRRSSSTLIVGGAANAGQAATAGSSPSIQAPSSSHSASYSNLSSPQSSYRDHPITLKVMRLAKPALQLRLPVYCGEEELLYTPESIIPHELADTCTRSTSRADLRDSGASMQICPSHEFFGLRDDLMLPYSFGYIYVGETFRSFLCLHNESPAAGASKQRDCYQWSLTAEVHALGEKRQWTVVQTPVIAEFESAGQYGYIAEILLKEAGMHMLSCVVDYVDSEGERRSLRKNFKFEVYTPIEHETKVIPMSMNSVLVQCEVKNLVHCPIVVHEAAFVANVLAVLKSGGNPNSDSEVEEEEIEKQTPTPAWSVTPMWTKACDGPWTLANHEIRQWVWKVEGEPSDMAMGAVELRWNSQMGESGWLRLPEVYRPAGHLPSLHVTVADVPSDIVVETPFTVRFSVLNRSVDDTLTLKVTFPHGSRNTLQVLGQSCIPLGSVAPQQTMEFSARFMSLNTGLVPLPQLELLYFSEKDPTPLSFLASDLPDVLVSAPHAAET